MGTLLKYLLYFMFSPSVFVCAQSYKIFNYSLEEGLPSSEVYQVYQDREGFIWFATDNGIVRYDGKEMQRFNAQDGLSDPVVFGFQEDAQGRVWFISYTGRLSYYENGEIKKYPFNDRIVEVAKGGIPTFDYSTKEKQLRLMSKNIVGTIDSTGNLTKTTLEKQGLYYFDSESGRGIWSITKLGLDSFQIYINNKEFPVELSKKEYHLSEYRSPARSIIWRGKLYLTIRNNIYCYDGKTVVRVYAGLAPIICLSLDKEDNLWIGYVSAGAEKVTRTDFEDPTILEVLKDKSITSILQDNDMGIWISTLENGVYYVPTPSIKNFYPINTSKILKVSTIGDSIFLSNQQGDFEIINSVTKKSIWKESHNSPVPYFYVTKSRNVFLFNSMKTFLLDSSMRIKKILPISSRSLVESKDTIWIYGDGTIGKFDRNGDLISKKRLAILFRSFILFESRFYLAGKTGLEIRDMNLELVRSLKSLEDFKISHLTPLSNSHLLISTLGSGLLLLDTRTFTFKKLDSRNNFIADNIYDIQKDGDNIWIGTEVGIIKLSIKSLLIDKPVYSKWDEKSGIINNDVKFLAITNNEVWAFTDKGYSIIPRDLFKEPQKNPTPYLKSIILNDSIFSKNEIPITINLPYDKTSISIHVGYLSFNNQDIKSRYRLSKTTRWEYTKERTFQFTNLAPAPYTFELEYSIDNVHWNPSGINFNFVVTPPWWKLWYFQTAIVLVALLIIVLYTWRQVKNYKLKNELLNLVNAQQQKLVHAEIQITERERKRIAKELHDGVGTSITAIKLGVMSQLAQYANSNTKILEIEHQFQSTLREIKDISYDLTPPDLERYGLFTAINNYVSKVSSSVGKEIRVTIFGKDLPEGELALSVFRILQELISNSLKHANAAHINITINSFNDLLSIIFEDDGIGFKPDSIVKGLGLANIESRVQLLNGTIHQESLDVGVSYLIDIPIKENNLD